MYKVVLGIENSIREINKARGMFKAEQELLHKGILILKGYTIGLPTKLISPMPVNCLLLYLSSDLSDSSRLVYCQEGKNGSATSWKDLNSDYFSDSKEAKLYKDKVLEYSVLLPSVYSDYVNLLGCFVFELGDKDSEKEIDNMLDFIIKDM